MGPYLLFRLHREARQISFVLWSWLTLVVALPAAVSEPAKRDFDLPADVAENSLRKFALQSGREVLFATRTVGKVRTNALRGKYLPLEAMTLVLAGTGLVVTQDERTGALTIASPPNG